MNSQIKQSQISNQTISPCCLTIAGSDSGGNAGVQADLRAFHSYGLHGCTVFAALTAQNPFGVTAIHTVPPDFVAAQLDAVLGVYSIRALKTGMLSDPASIEIIADRLAAHPEIAKVIDPVMIATSGARLVGADALDAIVRRLLPLATLVTPNLPEAEVLAGSSENCPHGCFAPECDCAASSTAASSTAARESIAASFTAARESSAARAADLARAIYERYGCAVLVKGGHGADASATDVLCTADGVRAFALPWVGAPVSTHGTGCTLAASLAAELALGRDVATAVAGAKRSVHAAIANACLVGPACGVLGFVPQNSPEKFF